MVRPGEEGLPSQTYMTEGLEEIMTEGLEEI
jgi:hypothetical protein